jgi:hypothetical protein
MTLPGRPNHGPAFSLSCESREAIAAVRASRESSTFGSRSVRRLAIQRALGTLAEPPSHLSGEPRGYPLKQAPGFSFLLCPPSPATECCSSGLSLCATEQTMEPILQMRFGDPRGGLGTLRPEARVQP